METRDNPGLPRVSVIIPVYHDAAGLLRCLSGLENQFLAFIDADCIPERHWLSAGVAWLIHGGRDYFVSGEVEVLPTAPRAGTGLYQYLTGFEQRKNMAENVFLRLQSSCVRRASLLSADPVPKICCKRH